MESSNDMISMGPWGGPGGTSWNFECTGRISKIIIIHGGAIDSIMFSHNVNGKSTWSDKFGGNGGGKTDKVVLEHPEEYLTSISGVYGSFRYGGPTVTKSITFFTNLCKYGPYGPESGTCFNISMEKGMIVGFHGRAGKFLVAIGVHVKPLCSALQDRTHCSKGDCYVSSSNACGEDASKDIEGPYFTIRDGAVSGPGPSGADGGRTWDDGVFKGIKQIILKRGRAAINSIQMDNLFGLRAMEVQEKKLRIE